MIIIPRTKPSEFKKFLDAIAFSSVKDIKETIYRSSPCCRSYFIHFEDKISHEFEIEWKLTDEQLVDSFKKFLKEVNKYSPEQSNELSKPPKTKKPMQRRAKKDL